MYLTKEEESILDGNEGEMLSKLMRFIVEIGDSFGAEKLVEIVSAHTVLNIELTICRAAAEVLHRIAESGLKVADRTHELFKKDVTDKVLIFPIPIGTTTLGFVLLETIVRKIGPKAIVCAEGEPLMSSGAVAADIFFDLKFPIVDQINFSELEKIENGTTLRVNGNEGIVEIL